MGLHQGLWKIFSDDALFLIPWIRYIPHSMRWIIRNITLISRLYIWKTEISWVFARFYKILWGGKHKGKSRISKRGRKRLRYLLFEAALSLAATNPEFKELHRYYTSREQNPLKKIQSLMALSNKLIRVFYTILKNGADYDPEKLLNDIRRPEGMSKVA